MATIRWDHPVYNLDDKNTVYATIADLDAKLQAVGLIPTTGVNPIDQTNKPYPVLTAGSQAAATMNLGGLHYLLPTGNGVVQFENDPVNVGYKRIVNASYDSTPVKLTVWWWIKKLNVSTLQNSDVTNNNYKSFYILQPAIYISNPSNDGYISHSDLNFAVSAGAGSSQNGNKTTPVTQSYVTLDNEFFAIGWNNAVTVTGFSTIVTTVPWWDLQFSFNRRNGVIAALGYINTDTKNTTVKPPRYSISHMDRNYYNWSTTTNANVAPLTVSWNDFHTYRFSSFYSGITGADIGYYPLYCNDVINNDYYAIPVLITQVGNTQVIQESQFAVKYRGENVVHKFIKIGYQWGGFAPYNNATIYTWQIKNETYPCTTSNL